MPSAKTGGIYFGVVELKLIKMFCAAGAMVFAMSLFCACQKTSLGTSGESGTQNKEVSIHTFQTPESTQPYSQSACATSPEYVYSATTDASDGGYPTGFSADVQQDIPPAIEFTLPEGFDLKISELMKKYSCNQSCNPENIPCGCQPELEAVTDEEGNIITPRDRVVSIYFMDMETGLEYTLNETVHYPVASTIKIPFAIYIYQKIDSGEIDPETVLTYEERHYFGGTGVIVNGEYGQQYTVAQLLELAITRSDNVAYEMLKDLTTWADFEAYLKEIGMTHAEDTRRSKQKICSESAGADGRLLAHYLTSGAASVEAFKEDLLNTRVKMIRSHYPVYRKYGWADFSFHDIAYVDAPHPYVLAVLTNLDGAEDDVYDMFREISYIFEELRNSEGQE